MTARPLLDAVFRDGQEAITEEAIVQLDDKTRFAFEAMVDASVVERYDGDLERLGESRHGEICYRPLDTDYVCRLLVDLWGELLTPEAINEAFDRLMEEQDEWPHGYCEEDEEDRPITDYRTEADEAADWFEDVRAGRTA